MTNGSENKHFDISRRHLSEFKHYQIIVKLMRDEKTEHHNLEVFTTGSEQLLEMRRIYAKACAKLEFRRIYLLSKNN